MDINEAILNLNWKREPYGLYEPIEYTLAAGGKRVRPQLALIASQMFGGDDEKVLPAALALEVFHNFTLLHDDVMDKADVRRGRPTVHVKWNENTAILSGDQMLIEAYKLLSGVPADKLPKVLQLFNKMATEICEGQQYDVDFESQEHVTIEEYLKMIRLKTSVLLANALQTGAYIAGADEQAQGDLYEFGINIGLAFQIQDDILDVWGDPKTFGKAVGGDICCNKKTFVLLSALMMADAVPEIMEYANLAAESLKAWFEYEGNHINCKPKNIDNGGYWEGIDYYNHSIYMYIIFAGLYRNRFNKKPFDDEAILKSIAEYIINFHYPSSYGDLKADFGDSAKGMLMDLLGYYVDTYSVEIKEAGDSYGRSDYGKRDKKEIGIHSLRMGSEVGTHEIIFAMGSQVITLKHEAENRSLFADGAVSAAEFLVKQEKGFYNMDNILE